MAVKVLITRKFKKGKEKEVFAALSQLRGKAMNQRGYITGETLVGREDQRKLLVIATWREVGDWLAWKDNTDRLAVEKEMAAMLEEPAVYEVYSFGVYSDRT